MTLRGYKHWLPFGASGRCRPGEVAFRRWSLGVLLVSVRGRWQRRQNSSSGAEVEAAGVAGAEDTAAARAK